MSRFSGLTRSARMRATGWLVLAAGVVCAVVSYWIQIRSADPALDDQTALGYTRAMRHSMGVMMGPFGLMLSEWQAAATSPLGEALIIIVCAALFAAYFFRVAWVLEQDDED